MIDKRLQYLAIPFKCKEQRNDITEFLLDQGFVDYSNLLMKEGFIVAHKSSFENWTESPQGCITKTLEEIQKLVTKEPQQDNTVITIDFLKARRDELKNKIDKIEKSMGALDIVINDLKR